MGKTLTTVHADGLKSLSGFALEIDPLTALAGENGSGKTSVLQAIRLSVLGYEPSVGKRLLEVRTQLASGTKNVETGLNFSDGFAIRRSFGASHEAIVSPPKGETTLGLVQKRIQDELGGFVLSLDLAELLDKTPEKRREYVFGLLPRERAELTEERFREVLAYEEQDEWIQAAIDKLWFEQVLKGETAVEGLASAIDLVNRKRLDAEEASRAKQHHVDELTRSIAEAKAAPAPEEYDADAVAELQARLSAVEEALAAAREDQKRAREDHKRLTDERDRYLKTKANVDKIAAQVEEAIKKVELLGEAPDVEGRSKEYDRATLALKEHSEGVEEAKETHDAVRAEYRSLVEKLDDRQTQLDAVKDAEVCPACGGTADLEAYRQRLRDEINALTRESDRMDTVVQKEVGHLAELVSARDAQRTVVEATQAAYNNARRVADQIASADANARQLSEQLAGAGELLASLNDPGEVEPLVMEDTVTPLEEKKKALTAELDAEQKKGSSGSRSSVLSEELFEAEAARDKAESREAALKALHKRLQALRGTVIQGMMRPIETVARDILHVIDPAKTFKFQYDREGREVLDFGFEEEGQFRSFASASNGESAFLIVVLLAALLEDLSPPWKVLILDNAEAIDDNRRSLLMDAIEQIKDRFDNVIFAGCCSFSSRNTAWTVKDMEALTRGVAA